MSKKYSERVNIIDVNSLDIENITAEIVINVKGHSLNCFASDYDSDIFPLGQSSSVFISLMTTECEILKFKETNIISTEEFEGHCILSGEIKNFIPRTIRYYDITGSYSYSENTEYKYGIVDCGV